MTWPIQSSEQIVDAARIKDVLELAASRGWRQIVIIGFNERDEYESECFGKSDSDKKFASERRGTCIEALRKDGLKPRMKFEGET